METKDGKLAVYAKTRRQWRASIVKMKEEIFH